MSLLKIRNDSVVSAEVKTYATSKSNPDAPKIKVAYPAEGYAFYKKPFSMGSEGRLFAARSLGENGKNLCIKEVRIGKGKRNKQPGKDFTSENACMSDIRELVSNQVDHGWTANRLHGPIRVFTNTKSTKAYIVQRVLSGTIKDAVNFMSNYEGLTRVDVVVFFALAIAQDLKTIHGSSILHLDIKADNICYDKQTQEIEIVDFGISGKGKCVFPWGSSKTHAPAEQQAGVHVVDASADIFALGVTFGELAIGRFLMSWFKTPNNKVKLFTPEHLKKLSSDKFKEREPAVRRHYDSYWEDMKNFHEAFAELASKMMSGDPTQRPNIDVVVENLKKMQTQSRKIGIQLKNAWDALPDYAPEYRKCLDALDAGLSNLGIEPKLSSLNIGMTRSEVERSI